MASSNINIRIDNDIKIQAQDLFASLGLDMTSAINVFLRQAIRYNGLPFTVTCNPVKKYQNWAVGKTKYCCPATSIHRWRILRIIWDELSSGYAYDPVAVHLIYQMFPKKYPDTA
jgi:addiction module RelB/DinJ family antitoxin